MNRAASRVRQQECSAGHAACPAGRAVATRESDPRSGNRILLPLKHSPRPDIHIDTFLDTQQNTSKTRRQFAAVELTITESTTPPMS
jgi:hypothetical protein